MPNNTTTDNINNNNGISNTVLGHKRKSMDDTASPISEKQIKMLRNILHKNQYVRQNKSTLDSASTNTMANTNIINNIKDVPATTTTNSNIDRNVLFELQNQILYADNIGNDYDYTSTINEMELTEEMELYDSMEMNSEEVDPLTQESQLSQENDGVTEIFPNNNNNNNKIRNSTSTTNNNTNNNIKSNNVASNIKSVFYEDVMSFIKEENSPTKGTIPRIPHEHLLSSSKHSTSLPTVHCNKVYQSKNQLEYLEDEFQLLALMVRSNAARMKVSTNAYCC